MKKELLQKLDAQPCAKTQKSKKDKKYHVNRKAWSNTMADIKLLINKNKYYTNDDFIKACNIAKNIIRGNNFNNKIFRFENLKVKNTYIFDLPSIMTCAGACAGCYALKAERIYKNTRIMRLYHLIIMTYAQYNKEFCCRIFDYIVEFLKTQSIGKSHVVVRLHSSGDFYNKYYLYFWLQVAEELKNDNIIIYTYTKQLTNDEIEFINNKYNNFNIVKSILKVDNKNFINYGAHDYIDNLAQKLKDNNINYHICTYGQDGAKTCMGNCHACCYCSNILFYQH